LRDQGGFHMIRKIKNKLSNLTVSYGEREVRRGDSREAKDSIRYVSLGLLNKPRRMSRDSVGPL